MGSVPLFKSRTSLIFIFVFISIGIVTLGFFYYEHQKKIIKQAKWLQLSAIANLKTGQIVNWFNERQGDTATILGIPFIADHVSQFLENPGSSSIRQEILGLMTSFQKKNQYEQISLLDARGRVLLSTQEGAEEIASYTKSLVPEAIAKMRVVFSDFYRHERSRRIFINFIAPISDPKRPDVPSVGAFLLRIDPSQFLYPLIQSNPTTSQSLESMLVRREGTEVLVLSKLHHMEDAPFNLRFRIEEKPIPSQMDSFKRELIFESLDYRGVPVLISLRYFEDLPWRLIVKVDQKEVYAPIRGRAMVIAALIGLLILGGILAGRLIWRHQHAEYQKRYNEAELERKALSEHFDYLTRYANDIILLMDENFKIIEANDRAAETYGYAREELLQMDLKGLRALETRSTLERHMALLKEQNGIIVETLHQKKDGTNFPVECSLRIIEKKGSLFYQNIIRNISERKQIEKELRESEERFRRVAESNMIGILFADKDGRVSDANDAYLQLIGYTREELLAGKINWQEITPPEYFPSNERAFRETESFGPCTPFEKEYIRKDGSRVPVLIGGARLKNSEEEYVGFALDLTDRKRAEDLLQRSEQGAIKLAKENEIMAEIGRIISSTPNIEDVYERFAEEVVKIIPFDHIGIAILNETSNNIIIKYSSGINALFRPTGFVLNLPGTVTDQILKTKSPIIIQAEDENAVAARFPTFLPSFRAGNRSLMGLPLISKDQAIGVIIFHSKKTNTYGERDLRLGGKVANQIAGAVAAAQLFSKQKRTEMERERLLGQLAQNQVQLRNLSRRLVEVQETERRHLAVELHDRIGQNLAAMNINLNVIKNRLSTESMERTSILLKNFLKMVDDSMKHVRNIMTDLRPPVLDDYGLASALAWYGGQLSAHNGLSITVIGEEFKPRLSLNVEDTLFRITQEALNNVIKHAQTKDVTILLESPPGMARLTIADVGLGFEPASENRLDNYPKWGLITMRERAMAVNGDLRIESQPGKGTKVIVEIHRTQ